MTLALGHSREETVRELAVEGEADVAGGEGLLRLQCRERPVDVRLLLRIDR